MLATITALVQIAFWIVIGTITLLTLLQARRTILQPLRTEVFKQQLQAMSRLLNLFVAKGEVDLRNYFGLEAVFVVNAHRLFDDYAKRELHHEISDESKRPYNADDCPEMRISHKSLLTDYWQLADNVLVVASCP